MQWLPCSAASHDAGVTTARFGHSAVTISGAGSVWGTDLVVVFGGVSYSDGEASLEHHAALSDVVVLQSELQEQGMWFAPQCTGVAGACRPLRRADQRRTPTLLARTAGAPRPRKATATHWIVSHATVKSLGHPCPASLALVRPCPWPLPATPHPTPHTPHPTPHTPHPASHNPTPTRPATPPTHTPPPIPPDDHGGEPAVPDARAFHAAAAVDRRMYVFGGHVLSFDADQNKKRRRFFNDLWCLDTVRRSCHESHQVSMPCSVVCHGHRVLVRGMAAAGGMSCAMQDRQQQQQQQRQQPGDGRHAIYTSLLYSSVLPSPRLSHPIGPALPPCLHSHLHYHASRLSGSPTPLFPYSHTAPSPTGHLDLAAPGPGPRPRRAAGLGAGAAAAARHGQPHARRRRLPGAVRRAAGERARGGRRLGAGPADVRAHARVFLFVRVEGGGGERGSVYTGCVCMCV